MQQSKCFIVRKNGMKRRRYFRTKFQARKYFDRVKIKFGPGRNPYWIEKIC